MIDTSGSAMNYAVKQATRSLGYAPAAKVGIQFKRAWWIWDLDGVGSHNIKQGGLGHSDLTIRTCVYPSYNILDPEGTPAVLLCSFTWSQDAERLGALMSSLPEGPDHLGHAARNADDDRLGLPDLLFRELARMHTPDGGNEEAIYGLIKDNYVDHFSHDWTHDRNTPAAFAYFRPQQFTNMWNKMIQPSGDLVLIGEAASPHHSWVVGALESAVHAVHSWLIQNAGLLPGADAACKELERTDDIDDNPFIGLPPHMDIKTARWHGALGSLHRDDHMWHMKRQESLRAEMK